MKLTRIMQGGENMKDEYDFSNGIKNPYAAKLKKQITINISSIAIEYFKDLSKETGIPYQTLINQCLTDCAVNKRRPYTSWK